MGAAVGAGILAAAVSSSKTSLEASPEANPVLFVSEEFEPALVPVLPTLPWERIREEPDKSKATCQMRSEAETGVPLGPPLQNQRFPVNKLWEPQLLHPQ